MVVDRERPWAGEELRGVLYHGTRANPRRLKGVNGSHHIDLLGVMAAE